jgi:hypothetical protein
MLPGRGARGYEAYCSPSRAQHLVSQVFLRLLVASAHPMHASGKHDRSKLGHVGDNVIRQTFPGRKTSIVFGVCLAHLSEGYSSAVIVSAGGKY